MSYCRICETRLVFAKYIVCESCYSGVRGAISLIENLQNNQNSGGGGGDSGDIDNLSRVFTNCLRCIDKMNYESEELKDKLAYLGGFVDFFKEQIQTDIKVHPGNDGSPIPAHSALLAARSNIFKNMLSSDGIMAMASDKIALPEFSYEELDCFLKLIYSGQLTKEKLEKHLYSMSIAADKYDIPFLAKYCERQWHKSLNPDNALEVLEISHTCSSSMLRLKELALNFIVRNMDKIAFSAKFDEFVLKNPHLGAEITRATFMDSKRKRVRSY